MSDERENLAKAEQWLARQVEWDSRGYACWRDDHGYLGEPVTTPQLSGERL